MKKERKYLIKKHYIGNSSEFLLLVLEVLILLPHPTVLTQNIKVSFHTAWKYKTYYKLNEILNLLLLLRIYLVARFLVIASPFYGNRAHRTCQFYAVVPNYWFSVKCILKSHPYITISVSLLAVLLVFGEAIRICERLFYFIFFI